MSLRTTRTTSRDLHDGWTFQEVDAKPLPNTDLKAWWPAEVPGHVHLDLLRLGVIPEPFDRLHQRTVQWVDEVDWAYRCTFEVTPEEADGARLLLRFGGLDTVATVLLDGSDLLTVDNMFVAHEVDATDRLTAGTHELEVCFAAAHRTAEERKAAWVAADSEREVFAKGLPPRSMLRKAQYAWGWDWGPCLRGCGIWQPVELVRVPVARIDDWHHTATFAADGSCSLAVSVTVDGDAESVAVALEHQGSILTADAPVVAGFASATLAIDEPARWWPNGLGPSTLHPLTIELVAGGLPVDLVDAQIGLRTVELIREPDTGGESFQFRVNGVDLFVKGANWIPDDSFPARTTMERVRTLLELSAEAHMNMIRIWGGGLYESEDLYDACDELGLLVWQDFAFACAPYPDDDESCAVVEAEALAAVRRIRHHASIALWCGGNENQWLGWFGAYGRTPRLLGERLYDEVLPSVVAASDPTTPYWPSSPYGNVPGQEPPEGQRGLNPSAQDAGDCHDWNVWHGAGDWRHYTECTARFVSEFGFSGPPDLLTLEESLLPGDLGVDTPAMRWHDKTNKGYETYLGYIRLHYPDPASVEDLVHYGQLNQADAMSFGIEHFRRLRPHTMGTLVWQLNDLWPVQSWAWIDSALRPKLAWYAAKRFHAPLLVSPWREGDRLRVHLVNDDAAAVSGSLVVRVLDHTGEVLWSAGGPAVAEGATSVDVFDSALPAEVLAAADHAIVHVSFADASGTLLLAEPKELRLPPPAIAATTAATDSGVRIRLQSPTLAVGVVLRLDGADPRWSDNGLVLLPGEPKEVDVTTDLSAAEVRARLRWRSL